MLDKPHPDRRQAERHRSLLRARMSFEGMTSSIECEIRNLSDSGVAIDVDGDLPIPPAFMLEIPAKGRWSRMNTAWRGANRLGASFVNPLPAPDSGPKTSHDQRLADLEAENAGLRQKIKQLQAELAMRAALADEGI